MTHTLIKRGQARGQGGFAIGLILLVVLLIAVIIAAIALATRNGTSKGNEKDRVAASNLVQQAVSLDQTLQRTATSNGTPYWGFTIINRTTTVNFNSGSNLYGANGGLTRPPAIDKTIYSNKCAGAANYVNLNTDAAQGFADASVLGCQWHITTIWGRNAAATNATYTDADKANLGGVGVLYTFPISGTVGSQVNNILWAATPGKSIKIAGTGTVSTGLGKNWPASAVSPDGKTFVAPGTALTQSTAVTFDFVTGAWFRKFNTGNDPVTGGTTNGAGIATAITTAGQRFPNIGSTSRREGVVQIGGSTQADDVIVDSGATAGARVYYRALNTITE
jgi:hypothetical protein